MNKILPTLAGVLVASSIASAVETIQLSTTTFDILKPSQILPKPGNDTDTSTTYASTTIATPKTSNQSPYLLSTKVELTGNSKIYPSTYREGTSLQSAASEGYFITKASFDSDEYNKIVGLAQFRSVSTLANGYSSIPLTSVSFQMIQTDSTGYRFAGERDNYFTLTLNITGEGVNQTITLDNQSFRAFSDVNQYQVVTFNVKDLDIKSDVPLTFTLSGAYTGKSDPENTGNVNINLGIKSMTLSTQVPEPTSATLGLIGIGSLLLRRRRKE